MIWIEHTRSPLQSHLIMPPCQFPEHLDHRFRIAQLRKLPSLFACQPLFNMQSILWDIEAPLVISVGNRIRAVSSDIVIAHVLQRRLHQSDGSFRVQFSRKAAPFFKLWAFRYQISIPVFLICAALRRHTVPGPAASFPACFPTGKAKLFCECHRGLASSHSLFT